MTEHTQSVSVEREIAAPPEKIFDVLADPSQHPVIDGSGTVKDTRGVPYAITNTVVEFEEGRRIAWRHIGGHRWRYELEPVDSGTRVRETYDWSTALLGTRLYIVATGWPKRAEKAMTQTLERLDARVTGAS
jgi:uncharacterized protein YndB with AHSA1/START domain